MAAGRCEAEGDLVAWHLLNLPTRIWAPTDADLDELNPYRPEQPLSEAMLKYLESERKRRGS